MLYYFILNDNCFDMCMCIYIITHLIIIFRRILDLQSKLRDSQTELLKERRTARSMILQLQSRVHDSGSMILKIQQKSEDLENRIEQFQNENDLLAKTNQQLRTEIENKTKLQSTTQTFYEMRRQQDMQNLNKVVSGISGVVKHSPLNL